MTKVMEWLQRPFSETVLQITDNNHCFPQRFFTGYHNDSSRSQYFEKTSNYSFSRLPQRQRLCSVPTTQSVLVTSGIITAVLTRHSVHALPPSSQLPASFLSLGSHFFEMFSVSGVLSHDPLGLASVTQLASCYHFTTEKKNLPVVWLLGSHLSLLGNS